MGHIYDSFRNYVAVGSANLASVTIGALLVNTTANVASGYVFSAAHTTRANVPAVAQVAVYSLSNVAVSTGRVNADDLAIPSVSGAPINAGIYFVATANSSTSPLIAIQSSGSGFPLSPDGGTINVTFPNADPFILKV